MFIESKENTMSELEKNIIDLLPKTRDGSVKIPNSSDPQFGRAWYVAEDGVWWGVVVGDCYTDPRQAQIRLATKSRRLVPIGECYGTEEAAKAAYSTQKYHISRLPVHAAFTIASTEKVYIILSQAPCHTNALDLLSGSIERLSLDTVVRRVKIGAINWELFNE
jgi:hypothetical protein